MYNDDIWNYEIGLSAQEGLTSARALDVEAALDLLQRFGWRGITLDLLRDIQTEAFGPEPQ
ncbi:hypothetical protein [Agreia bicolorata]|uniref:Uncharacterized protein n=1 Tax=Agreia bicolorata TaxID=110935 RepID=A0ABR5CGD9_9MICO|nr:hypothetical protein [Agreia bicolorata]KJC64682.1 hypothetical protein TZ00_10205 [Agreia bicolorata]